MEPVFFSVSCTGLQLRVVFLLTHAYQAIECMVGVVSEVGQLSVHLA